MAAEPRRAKAPAGGSGPLVNIRHREPLAVQSGMGESRLRCNRVPCRRAPHPNPDGFRRLRNAVPFLAQAT